MKEKLRLLQINHFILPRLKNAETENGAVYISLNQVQWLLTDVQSKKQGKHVLEVFLQVQFPCVCAHCLVTSDSLRPHGL